MRKVIKATTGRSTSTDYIKVALFDYLCDIGDLRFGDVSAEKIVDRIEGLSPIFDVDDVLNKVYEDGIEVEEAIDELEDELDQM